MPYLQRHDTVFVLDLGEPECADAENRLSPQRIGEIERLLDEVDRSSGPAALVTTGTGKFYSNGFEPHRFDGDPGDVRQYLLAAQRLFARLVAAEYPTVAAIQGHACAAGAILATAHDYRIMRADRGFFWLPEIRLRLSLPDGLAIPGAMTDLLLARLPRGAAHHAILGGHRYGGREALRLGIIDAVEEEEGAVLAAAVARAESLADTRGQALALMKRRIYADVLSALTIL